MKRLGLMCASGVIALLGMASVGLAAPTADFTADKTTGTAPLTVTFSDASTDSPTSWSWDFGDPGSGAANSSTLQSPSHTYSAAGSYTVSLTATNASGSDTKTKTGYITIADPLSCAGYPGPPRAFFETQAWWLPTGASEPAEQVHVGTCFPVRQTVSGVLPFDVHVAMHANDGNAYFLSIQIFGKAGGVEVALVPLNLTGEQEAWVHVDLDTARFPNDGRQEFRFRVKTSHGAALQFPSTRLPATLANGKPVLNYRNKLGGAGWYTGAGYQNAFLASPFLSAPLSGVWNLTIQSEGAYIASVDPASDGSGGTVVAQGAAAGLQPVSIDTQSLSNGLHHLFVRSDKPIASGRNSGVVVVPFVVSN